MKFVCAFVAFLLSFTAVKLVEGNNLQELLRETVIEYNARNNSIKEELTQIRYESESVPRLEFATGMVSQQCLQCICMQESGCRKVGCRMDVGSLSCGYFQIKQNYWIDCGKLGGDWKSCADDKQCASQCVQNYMKRYAQYYGCPLKCEGFAREHNGGPQGCKNPNTLKYWNSLQKIPGCRGVQM